MKQLAFVFAFAFALAIAASGWARPQFFHADLDGLQQVPPNASPGVGDFDGTLNGGPGTWVLTYTVSFSGLTSGLTDAHIHDGAAGTNGPVVHPFDNRPFGATSGTFSGDWRFDDAGSPLTDALAARLISGNTYANIHTSNFPGGEIRGQILQVPEPASVGILVLGSAFALRRTRRS